MPVAIVASKFLGWSLYSFFKCWNTLFFLDHLVEILRIEHCHRCRGHFLTKNTFAKLISHTLRHISDLHHDSNYLSTSVKFCRQLCSISIANLFWFSIFMSENIIYLKLLPQNQINSFDQTLWTKFRQHGDMLLVFLSIVPLVPIFSAMNKYAFNFLQSRFPSSCIFFLSFFFSVLTFF